MTTREVHYKANKYITPCPKCGNNTKFTIASNYCAEDCCEIWATCKCGYCPTDEEWMSGNRVEDVWGGVGDDNCRDAIEYSWNECLEDLSLNKNKTS